MIALRFIQGWTALTMISLTASGVAVDEPKTTPKPLSAARCVQLVEQLANPGKPPFTESYVLCLPRGVKESGLYEAQKPIAAAYNELSANIEIALPVLAAHLDDERFSYVYEDGISGVYQCQTIGGACARIIDEHVNVYSDAVTKRDDEGRIKSLWFIEDECGGFEKWWKDRPGKSLGELQREAIEWAIRQPQPDHFSSREWANATKSLDRMAKQILASKKPIRVDHKVQFFSK